MTIHRRLVLLSALGVSLMLAVGLASFLALSEAAHRSRHMLETDQQIAVLAVEVRTAALMLRRYEKDVFLNLRNPAKRRDYQRQHEVAQAHIEDRMRALLAFDLAAEDARIARQMRANLDIYERAMGSVLRDVEAGRITTPEEGNQAITPFKDHIRKLDEDGASLAENATERLRRAQGELAGRARVVAWLIASMAALFAITSVLADRFVRRSVVRPLSSAVSVLEHVASGDLSGRVQVERQDEVGRLGVALNTAIAQMRHDREEIERLAAVDPLTHLLNRRAFTRSLEVELTRGRRYDYPLCLLLIDVDFFKSINDRFGHNVGDEVLVQLAKLLQTSLRTSDLAARWGGEEFVAALPHTDLAGAIGVAERIRIHAEALQFADKDHNGFGVTVSIGVVAMRPQDSLHTLVDRADRSMYLAKSRGRNRVVADGDGDGLELASSPRAQVAQC